MNAAANKTEAAAQKNAGAPTKTEIAVSAQPNEIMPSLSGGLQSFELAQRVARVLATSTLVPKEYQNNMSNCIIALNMATRMNADPLMVMQNLYIVHGRPGWSSQFMISCFNACGRFSALRYEWVGKEGTDEWGCRAWAVEIATNERIEGSLVTISIAKKEGWHGKAGSKWQTMPQQMLMYRAASWFIRAYAPEISNGMHTADEIEDVGHDFRITDAEVIENANSERFDAPPPPPQPVQAAPVTTAPAAPAQGVDLFTNTEEKAGF
jgi:hypothetical protein